MKTKKIIIIVSVFLVLISIVPTVLFWKSVGCSFFSYSLMDILNVICAFLIGIVVTAYFSHTFNNSAKRLDIIVENLNNLQDYYTRIIEAISDSHQNKLTDVSKTYLLRLFRFASNELHNLEEYLIDEKSFNEYLKNNLLEIKEKHFSLKEITTDVPFAANQIISENDIKYSIEHFYFMKQKIQKIKLHLYK